MPDRPCIWVCLRNTWYLVPGIAPVVYYSGNPNPRIPVLLLTVLVRVFESRRGEILNLFAKIKRGSTAESAYVAWVSTVRRESTREERAEPSRDKNARLKTCTVVRRGRKECPLRDPMVDLSYEREGAGEVGEIQ